VAAPIFHRLEDKIINYPRILSDFHQYADKNRLIFIDLAHDSIRFNKDFYSDLSHLNKAGAMAFTRHFSLALTQYIRP
ncbi:MAG TPA: hypothetical protein VFJ43_14995, partial [Bacteroidia bacterium]|nr:hypothetical protein [Bacteroidia bacterium]